MITDKFDSLLGKKRVQLHPPNFVPEWPRISMFSVCVRFFFVVVVVAVATK